MSQSQALAGGAVLPTASRLRARSGKPLNRVRIVLISAFKP